MGKEMREERELPLNWESFNIELDKILYRKKSN